MRGKLQGVHHLEWPLELPRVLAGEPLAPRDLQGSANHCPTRLGKPLLLASGPKHGGHLAGLRAPWGSARAPSSPLQPCVQPGQGWRGLHSRPQLHTARGSQQGGGCATVCLTGTAPAGSDGGQGRRRRRRVSCRAARFPCCAAAPSAGRMGAGCWTRTQGWPSRPCRAAVCHQPNQISRSGEQFSSPWESVRSLCWLCMWLPASGMGPCRAWGQRALP